MDYVVIDVREPDEFVSSHIEGAINVPLGRVLRGASELNNMPKDANLIVYCRSGSRSGVAENALKQQGFANVTNGINQDQVEANFNL